MVAEPADVLDFWFNEVPVAGKNRWFVADDDFDELVRRRFEPTVDAAWTGKLAPWLEAARSRLALIIVCDQFTRNIYRGDARAFALDGRARHASLEGIELEHDKELAVVERAFFYMPLMHAEDRALQDRSVALFAELRDEAPPGDKDRAASFLKHARWHRDMIERFGRFPGRNKALKRTSTPAEQAYLDGS